AVPPQTLSWRASRPQCARHLRPRARHPPFSLRRHDRSAGDALGLSPAERAVFAAGRRRARHRRPVVRRHNLPSELSALVGRTSKLADLRQALGAARLLTLVGTGGVGKSRLGLRLAEESVHNYRDGVWLVELASTVEPAQVPKTLASVLGIAEHSGRSL